MGVGNLLAHAVLHQFQGFLFVVVEAIFREYSRHHGFTQNVKLTVWPRLEVTIAKAGGFYDMALENTGQALAFFAEGLF